MLHDGLKLLGGSAIENASIETGDMLPVASEAYLGRLFYIPGDAVYVCDGSEWHLSSIVPASLVYKHLLDASVGELPEVPESGEYHLYLISQSGTIDSTNYAAGDVVIWTGETLQKLIAAPEEGGVRSVNGQQGAVDLSDTYLGKNDQAADAAKVAGFTHAEILSQASESANTAISDALDIALPNKADAEHTHTLNEVEGLTAALGGKASISGSVEQDFSVKSLNVSYSILPTGTGIDIGSAEQRFRGIYVDEAYLSTNTLYIGDTPILGTSADTIVIKADPNQSINMQTTGSGHTQVQSNAGVMLGTTGMNADVQVNAPGSGSKVRVGAQQSVDITSPAINLHGSVTVQNDQQVGGNLTVTGNLTVNGTNTVVNTQTVQVKDNILSLNHGQVGSGVSAQYAGLNVDRGDLQAYRIVFDEVDDLFKVGMVGDLETLASREWVSEGYAPIVHSHVEASTTVSGFMSAADKAKLNRIQDGATANADMSKEDIDELRVDAGTVNGKTVDANVPANAKFTDTVYSDAEVRNLISGKANVAHDHTVANVAGLQAELEKRYFKNANNGNLSAVAKDFPFIEGTNITGAPTNGFWNYINTVHKGGNVVNFTLAYNHSSADGSDIRYGYANGSAADADSRTWTWYRMWHSGNFNPDTKLDKSGGVMTGGLTTTNVSIDGAIPTLTLRETDTDPAKASRVVMDNGDLYLQAPAGGAVRLSGYTNTDITGATIRIGGVNRSIWHEGNFNPSTKLDATAKATDSELLDGINSTQFLRSDVAQTFTGKTLMMEGGNAVGNSVDFRMKVGNDYGGMRFDYPSEDNGTLEIYTGDNGSEPIVFTAITNNTNTRTNLLALGTAGPKFQDQTIWHAGNFDPSVKVDISTLSDLGIGTSEAPTISNLETTRGTRCFSFSHSAIGSPYNPTDYDAVGWQVDGKQQRTQFASLGNNIGLLKARVADDQLGESFNEWHTFFHTGNVPQLRESIASKHLAVSNVFNLAAADLFTVTVNSSRTFSVTNIAPAGTVSSFILEIINGGAHSVTFWAGIRWSKGSVPQLTASGKDVLGFYTYDGGATWVGLLLGTDVK